MRDYLVRQLELNSAVVLSVFLKFWQVGAGLLSLVLVGLHFAPDVQGFYYTFVSLVALQSFVELGLYLVISNAASHEWSKLTLRSDGCIEGDPLALSRLVFCLFAGAGGYWFLGTVNAQGVDWQAPWLLHIVFSSLLLWCMPFLSLLEGCEQFAQVAKFRLRQALASNCCFWAAILLGAKLWAVPVLSAVSLVLCVHYVVASQRNFFQPFFRPPEFAEMRWKEEILPMQWRLAAQGVMNYFVFSLFTPVMFHYHCAVTAGQMGMSLQLVNAAQSVASVWILTKAPRFGVLVARREFNRLDDEWERASRLTMGMMVLGTIILLVVVGVMAFLSMHLADRMLQPVAFALLGVGAVFSVGSQSLAVYLRAYRREVLMAAGTVSGAMMGLMVWQLGSRFCALGASAAYAIVMSAIAFPMALFIWNKSRQEWH